MNPELDAGLADQLLDEAPKFLKGALAGSYSLTRKEFFEHWSEDLLRNGPKKGKMVRYSRAVTLWDITLKGSAFWRGVATQQFIAWECMLGGNENAAKLLAWIAENISKEEEEDGS